jgi:hypothetical protein
MSLTPAGVMPVDEDFRLSVRFCSEDPLLTTQTIVISRETGGGTDDEDMPCSYAALSTSVALLRPVNWPLAIIVAIQTIYFPAAHVAPGAGLAAPPPFATGPPTA